jgi:hypothetical protein
MNNPSPMTPEDQKKLAEDFQVELNALCDKYGVDLLPKVELKFELKVRVKEEPQITPPT